MQTFIKYAIQRSDNGFVSVDGSETTSIHNARLWSNIERAEDELNATWKPGKFIFKIPQAMQGNMKLIGPYTDTLVKGWKIVTITITASF